MTTILFLAADPTDASRLRLGEESREIQEKLQLSRQRDSIFLYQRFSVRPEDFTQALLDVNPQIVHFSGHGYSDGSLCFENKLGSVQPVSPDALAALFAQFAKQVKCVILNACYSETQANAIAKHIDFVIGMNQAVGDKAAIAFTVGFYQALGAERTIEEAYRLGCVQIQLQGLPDHAVPVLLKRDSSSLNSSHDSAKEKPRPYEVTISRSNPALLVFLIDQSGSMADLVGNSNRSRAMIIAELVNTMLSNLVIRASVGESVRDYFHIAILGYGAQFGKVSSAFRDELAQKEIVSISKLAESPLRIESRKVLQPDGQGGGIPVEVKIPIWIEPIAGSDAPMCQALRKTYRIINDWINSGHNSAFPPIIINITDGASTDGDPRLPAKNLAQLSTSSGNVLLFNCCFSYTSDKYILFPESGDNIPDEYGKVLFEMSSPLTPRMRDFARALGHSIGEKPRGFAYQTDLLGVIQFLDIGTRPAYLS